MNKKDSRSSGRTSFVREIGNFPGNAGQAPQYDSEIGLSQEDISEIVNSSPGYSAEELGIIHSIEEQCSFGACK